MPRRRSSNYTSRRVAAQNGFTGDILVLSGQQQQRRARRVVPLPESLQHPAVVEAAGSQNSSIGATPGTARQRQGRRSRRPMTVRGTVASTATCEVVISPAKIVGNPDNVANQQRRRRARRAVVPRASASTSGIPAAVGGKHVPTKAHTLSAPTLCSHCGATKFMYESKGFCCSNGEVKLAANEFPPTLVDLFKGSHEDAVHFRAYARFYNNLFAFSSLGGSYEVVSDRGFYLFKLHGQMYHYVPDLLPGDRRPRYLQLYFYDGQHERENRLGCYEQLRPAVIDTLMSIMEDNPYACFFKSLSELNVTDTSRIILNHSTALDQRVYNAPTAEEVAAVWLDNSSPYDSSGPHIMVHGKSDQSHRIMHYYGCYDPLQYPLLFSKGECGWHQGLNRVPKNGVPGPVNSSDQIPPSMFQHTEDMLAREERVAASRPGTRGKQVTCKEYYAYKLQIRPGNYLLMAGRLLQQYIVDMYVKLENTRLDFFRKYQDVIRADLYQEVVNTVVQGESDASKIGQRVILPASFIGGPRDMRRRYLNAMSLVQKYGKPDLFITMTCNRNWPEIKAQLGANELIQNRPDLVARIFHAKLVALKKQIMEKKVFGEVAALIYVVEFQKRGLPHAHLLIILKPGHKIQNPENFDKYVSAEIPGSENPHLREIVLKHMMHGPCGLDNLDCACMRKKDGVMKCKSSFPKRFNEFTTTGKDCYPMYKRRNTGATLRIRGSDMDNRWVIPYNPYLLAMFDCHINVEICSSIKAVKYLYKYVYKGHDRVSLSVVEGMDDKPVDEIENYQAGRWVSPPEAAWRIFGFPLFEIYPPVMPLSVHTHNGQFVRFNESENLVDVLANENNSKTLLTEFFRKNAEIQHGHKYLYSEFPEHFTWHQPSRSWRDRKRGVVIGRMAQVNPGDGERYYLRLLLANVRGPRSFDDLLTVNGDACATFQESALKRGLLEYDESIGNCMDEAMHVQMPHALRRLFATILIFCQPTDPKSLWEKYYEGLSEDYERQYPHNVNKVLQLTAQKVEEYLEGMGKSFSDFGLDHLHKLQDHSLRQSRDIMDALDAPIPEECWRARKELNPEQKIAYKAVVNRVKSGQPGAFFIDGPGGTGKTFLYCALYAKLRSMGKICLPTASSGIAASNIPTGRTAHSRFKIPTDEQGSMTCNVPKQSGLATLLMEASLIIWDEASMARKDNIEALDMLLRDLCMADVIFGGKVIVFGGDFRQVLPVLPKRTRHEAVEASLVSSHIWGALEKFRLTQNVRAQEDPAFSTFLLALGDGALQTQETEAVQLPQSLMLQTSGDENAVDLLSRYVFPEIEDFSFSPDVFTKRALLTPRNDDVDAINSLLIHKFPGCPRIYKGFDSVVDDNCTLYPGEFLNTLCPGGMSPHELVLKENCPVILLRNLDPAAGLCNGTRLICKRFSQNMIECEISTGHYKGEHVFLPRITLKPSTSSKYPFQFQRKQFPIKLSFAMTINKAQGQTLQRVGVYLPQPCFSHGQLYVALSRAKTAHQLKVAVGETTEEASHKQLVQNVVAFEVLRRAGIINA